MGPQTSIMNWVVTWGLHVALRVDLWRVQMCLEILTTVGAALELDNLQTIHAAYIV